MKPKPNKRQKPTMKGSPFMNNLLVGIRQLYQDSITTKPLPSIGVDTVRSLEAKFRSQQP